MCIEQNRPSITVNNKIQVNWNQSKYRILWRLSDCPIPIRLIISSQVWLWY